jgi:uridine kinase
VDPSEIPLLSTLSGAERLAEFLEPVIVPAGAVVVREGEQDRDMYFVLSGKGRIVRGTLEVDTIERGTHFGELALLAGKARNASLIAETEMRLAQLSVDRFDAMSREEPALTLAFTRAVLGAVGQWLTDMTASVELLLRERSLPRRTHVTVEVGGESRRVPTGTELRELLPTEVDGALVVAGLVDRRPMTLVSRLSSDSVVEPLTTHHWEGNRIYRDSIGLLLLEAARRRFPHLEVRLEHSIGFAQHVVARGRAMPPVRELAAAIETEMRSLVVEDLPLREEWWTVDEARSHFESVGWQGAAQLLATSRLATVLLATFGEVYVRHRPLAPCTGVLTGFRIRPDEGGLLLVFGEREVPYVARPPSGTAPDSVAPPNPRLTLIAEEVSSHTRGMMRDHRRWLRAIGAMSVADFNRSCIEGHVAQLVRVAEGYQEKQIGRIADAIAARGDTVKVVCIAGPSSSGKTTFIKRLRVQLQVDALFPVDLSLDDYYVDRDKTPRDENGELDYEAFDALDHETLQDHLERIVAGEAVKTPYYDFRTGKSIPGGGLQLELGDQEILLIEGIHGLNPKLVRAVSPKHIFRIFICPLAQLPFDRFTRVHASDVRLIRRIVRDRHTRGANAAANILRWPSVRRGERKHIFPYQHHADAVFDTSLTYELAVLKVYAERYLLEVPQGHEAYPTAFRLLRLLDDFVALYPDQVPPTSILREFIGGSGFEH